MCNIQEISSQVIPDTTIHSSKNNQSIMTKKFLKILFREKNYNNTVRFINTYF